MISFFVAGTPKPAGSKRGFFIPKINRVVITDACKGSKDWKTDVKHEAQRVYAGCPILLDALTISFRFVVARPKAHWRSNGELKPNAKKFPTSKPDCLKLARAAEDALTGVIYADDAQNAAMHITKAYQSAQSEPTGVHINIKKLE